MKCCQDEEGGEARQAGQWKEGGCGNCKPDGTIRAEEGGAEGKGLVSVLPAGRRTKEESAAFGILLSTRRLRVVTRPETLFRC